MLFLILVLFAVVISVVLLEGLQESSDILPLMVSMMLLALQYVHYVIGAGYVYGKNKQRKEGYTDPNVAADPSGPPSSPEQQMQMQMAKEAEKEADDALQKNPHSKKKSNDDNSPTAADEDLASFSDGLTMYMSCYNGKSYSDRGGKVWKNVVKRSHTRRRGREGPSKKVSVGDEDDDEEEDLNLHFNRTPAFSRKDGFVMGSNTITGPYSFQMGIRGDMAYSIFVVCSFTGTTSGGSDGASVFKVYANTPGNNGISMTISANSNSRSSTGASRTNSNSGSTAATTATAEGQQQQDATALPSSTGEGTDQEDQMDNGGNGREGGGSLLRLGIRVHISDEHSIDCKVNGRHPLTVSTSRKYLFAIVKNYARVQVSVLDLDDPDNPRTQLADVNIGSHSPVLFSNRDMTINEKGNWHANIQAFGCYERAISDRDTTKLYHHYRRLHKRFDPVYQRMVQEMSKVNKIRACPFDEATCNACSSVDDWSNFQKVFVADDACKSAIARFCANNPSHDRCSCWSINHPAYNTSCKVYRCALGGSAMQHECSGSQNERKSEEDRSATREELKDILRSVMREREDADNKERLDKKKGDSDNDNKGAVKRTNAIVGRDRGDRHQETTKNEEEEDRRIDKEQEQQQQRNKSKKEKNNNQSNKGDVKIGVHPSLPDDVANLAPDKWPPPVEEAKRREEIEAEQEESAPAKGFFSWLFGK